MPLQPLGPKPPGRNDPCHCGSGKKYKRCCLDADQQALRETEEVVAEALPLLREKYARAQEYERRLREEYGVFVNYVSPIEWQGRKVWALGSRLYLDGPPSETFHDFLLRVLRGTFGEAWAKEQSELPEDERHFVFTCNERFAAWQAENADPAVQTPEGHYRAEPNGWVQYLISLAWDIASLIHEGALPDDLLRRLRHAEQFQGARYEVAIAAIFARLDCSIRFLDEDEELRGRKHVEFVATHRPTGGEIAVEAKSRHRPGVVNVAGEQDTDPLKGDGRALRKLYMNAIAKRPEGTPFFVFIDVNAPSDTVDRWPRGVQKWVERLPQADDGESFDSLIFTNFSPHYDGDDISGGGSWIRARRRDGGAPVHADLESGLAKALTTYGRVPAIAGDHTLLD
jgi:hypothetical protein